MVMFCVEVQKHYLPCKNWFSCYCADFFPLNCEGVPGRGSIWGWCLRDELPHVFCGDFGLMMRVRLRGDEGEKKKVTLLLKQAQTSLVILTMLNELCCQRSCRNGPPRILMVG